MLKILAESAVTLAERLVNGAHAVDTIRCTRLLLSGSECISVTGTDAEISAAAARLSRQTKSCVVVAVVVAYHHRRGCSDRRTAGIDAVGN
jgi:hypothetical protein